MQSPPREVTTCARVCRVLLLGLLFSSCVTARLTLAETQTCDAFGPVDDAVRAELDKLLASAPGHELVKESSRLNLARRACARHRISKLRELRESDGPQAVQQELDALSATYDTRDLRLLITEQLGPEAVQLEPLLVEARLRINREAAAPKLDKRDDEVLKGLAVTGPSREGPEPELPDTLCHEASACAQFECVVRENGDANRAARACLDALEPLEPLEKANELGRILGLLPPGVSGSRTEAMLSLERLRVLQWPNVERASREGKFGLAAQLAMPFGVLPMVAAQVSSLRDKAQAHHLARAHTMEATPEAKWLHRALAESFGGPRVELEPPAGTWQPTRWRCPNEAVPLPALPPGVSAMLAVRCEPPPAAPPKSAESDNFMSTFEMERDLNRKGATGSLTVKCAGKSTALNFTAEDRDAVTRELERLFETAMQTCTNQHRFASTASCVDLSALKAPELITRFVEHARFTRRWEPCFSEWLVATEGVEPPEVPAPIRAKATGLLDEQP